MLPAGRPRKRKGSGRTEDLGGPRPRGSEHPGRLGRWMHGSTSTMASERTECQKGSGGPGGSGAARARDSTPSATATHVM